MDGDERLERVRADAETELSRLGSEKILLAATDAQLEADAVAGVLAAAFERGSKHLEAWASDADDAALGRAMGEAADRFEELRADVLETWPDARSDLDGLVGELGGPASDGGRAGAGLVGLPLVLDGLLLQAVNFHVNEADETAAQRARELREEVTAIREVGAELLASRADEVGDGEAARAGAVAAIEAVYDEYATRLEAMGLDPRPIC